MKLNAKNPAVLGAPDLGAGAAQRWNPRTHDFYARQWVTQAGAFGDPAQVQTRLQGDVAAVMKAFAEQGTRAGLLEAKRRGILEAARLYVKVRGETEEELSARLATTRADLIKHPTLTAKLQEAFLAARLEEVQAATSKGHTPPQAVADKPEVPRRQVPRWVSYGALALSAIALVNSLVVSHRKPRSHP
jgi:hypothetical protein